jgi:hypothetical protein
MRRAIANACKRLADRAVRRSAFFRCNFGETSDRVGSLILFSLRLELLELGNRQTCCLGDGCDREALAKPVEGDRSLPMML